MSFALTHSAMRMPAIILVMLCGGCGAPVPDETVSVQPPSIASTGRADSIRVSDSLSMDDRTWQVKSSQEGTNRPAKFEQREDRGRPSNPPIPSSVASDLSSTDARVRYQALDYWEAKDSKTPLDPVFEAMEDHDEAVRARATEIVERHWAVEQEREQQEMKLDRERGERESKGG
jgi:hypothetical protein